MSLFRKIGIGIAVLGLEALMLGCIPPPSQNNQKTAEEQKETKHVLTKIVDVQYGTLNYEPTDPIGLRVHQYPLLVCEGGDIDKKVYMYPHSGMAFKKYIPVKLKIIQELPEGKIDVRDFLDKYIDHVHKRPNSGRYFIHADGIIKPEGVEYIEETEK